MSSFGLDKLFQYNEVKATFPNTIVLFSCQLLNDTKLNDKNFNKIARSNG